MGSRSWRSGLGYAGEGLRSAARVAVTARKLLARPQLCNARTFLKERGSPAAAQQAVALPMQAPSHVLVFLARSVLGSLLFWLPSPFLSFPYTRGPLRGTQCGLVPDKLLTPSADAVQPRRWVTRQAALPGPCAAAPAAALQRSAGRALSPAAGQRAGTARRAAAAAAGSVARGWRHTAPTPSCRTFLAPSWRGWRPAPAAFAALRGLPGGGGGGWRPGSAGASPRCASCARTLGGLASGASARMKMVT